MTLEELGQKVKQKYPVYKDIDDTELADKVIKKYPQYLEFLDQPQQSVQQTQQSVQQPQEQGSFLNTLAGGVGKVGGALTSLFGGKQIGTEIGKGLAAGPI